MHRATCDLFYSRLTTQIFSRGYEVQLIRPRWQQLLPAAYPRERDSPEVLAERSHLNNESAAQPCRAGTPQSGRKPNASTFSSRAAAAAASTSAGASAINSSRDATSSERAASSRTRLAQCRKVVGTRRCVN